MPTKTSLIPSYRYLVSDDASGVGSSPSGEKLLSVDECYRVPAARLVRLFTDRIQGGFDSLALDLLSVASGVFAADCLSDRSPEASSACGWRRSIEVTVPVREPDRWRTSEVQTALQAALNFVTGDKWVFHFVRHPGPHPDGRLFLPLDEDSRVCLFSEGLDSLCGLAHQLSSNPDTRFTAITASIQHQSGKRVKDAVVNLNRIYSNRVHQVLVPLQRRKATRQRREDGHHRSRSFLLLCIACVAALVSGSRQVEVYENGVEAFNFAFDDGLLDAQVSRAMHPLFLGRMDVLMTGLTGEEFGFREPFLLHTKHDMVTLLGDGPIQALVAATVSCMHYPIREKGPKQCGHCENCILRRVALFGTPWADEPYRGHFLHPASRDFTRMKMQMFQIETALRQTDPIPGLLRQSGLCRKDRDALLNAASQASGCRTADINRLFLGLFTRHQEQWTALPSMA